MDHLASQVHSKSSKVLGVVLQYITSDNKPRYDKVTVRVSKTQISLGIRPVWSESSLSAWRKFGSLATH